MTQLANLRRRIDEVNDDYMSAHRNADYDEVLRCFRLLQSLWQLELELVQREHQIAQNRAQLYESVEAADVCEQEIVQRAQRRSERLRNQRCEIARQSFRRGTHVVIAHTPRCDHCGLHHR